MDWTDPDSPARLVQEVEQEIGHIDILLNINRGPHAESFVHTEKFSDWWGILEQNLRTPIALIHAVLPHMIARGNGTIISTAFRSGVFHVPFTTSDSTIHSGIIRFHHGLDDEVRPKGICSYVVHPGLVASHLDDPELPDNRTHYILEPRIIEQKMNAVESIVEDRWCGAGLASGTFLALAADPKAKVLSGLYLDAERDLGELIEEVEKGDASRVVKEALHVLKVNEL
jgi:NAD(P)-dependent dehydrogenase (short-subunit alcohol dehydrogenase family)